MPTLFRFVAFLVILAGLVFGGMIALVTFVTPEPREMIEVVPPAKLQPR
ncbi:histidine kinase [Bosea sp. PAMC 26642]|nr:histidine kinase [Bosea sp. PAMC 26642]AMJ61936.1 histidine kinase [Bosea sp. PAMC 26642]